jgi:hypothetical protein
VRSPASPAAAFQTGDGFSIARQAYQLF